MSEGAPVERRAAVRALIALLGDARGDERTARLRGALRVLFCEMARARGLEADWHRGLCSQATGAFQREAREALGHAARWPAEALGQLYEETLGADARRARGSHYTSAALARRVVDDALAPLSLDQPDRILALRVCDPSMGAGAFLLAACRALAARLAPLLPGRRAPQRALAEVARRCLFGVDLDPAAVELAHLSLWLVAADPALPLDFAADRLRWADALAPEPPLAGPFDVLVGNPPWVSYAGRAAQPLASELRADYGHRFSAFRGYRNLQGLFVERGASLLAPRGRLGLVLPSSMAELAGYAPTRAAHDRLCRCDDALPDLGEDSFDGVFQPSMVLLSTRLDDAREADGDPWPLERPDLGARERALLDRLSGPTLPPALFGERGLQSVRSDHDHLRDAPDDAHTVALRVGADLEPFVLKAPSQHASPAHFGPRLRADEWRRVRLLIRQTARVPVAALSDGLGFRNSLLAGFADDEHPAEFLVAYLNSTPIRWLHYTRHRDARLGMPQVKISHLRAIPAPRDRSTIAPLAALGARLSACNQPPSPADQRALDQLAARALALSDDELAFLQGQARW